MIVKKFDRNLADVKRWGIVRTIRQQSVAEHSFYIGLWMPGLLEIAGHGDDDATVLDAMKYALNHDKDEVVSGDLPTPFKRRLQPGAFDSAVSKFGLTPCEPTPLIKAAAKVLDLFEALMFLAEECALGNRRMERIIAVIEGKLKEASNDLYHRYFTPEAKAQCPDLFGTLRQIVTSTLFEEADPLE